MNIKYFTGVSGLVGFISDKVAEVLREQDNKQKTVEKITTILDFATGELPTLQEFEAADDEEKEEMEEEATGWYGVAALPTPFDNNSVVFSIGYYGGSDLNVFNLPFGSTIDDIRQEVASGLNLIYSEVPAPTNFLVKQY